MNPILWELGDGIVVRTLTPDDDVQLSHSSIATGTDFVPGCRGNPRRVPRTPDAFIEGALASEHDREGNGIFLDGRLVGSAGMRVDTMDAKAEVGYWIDGEAEGRGIVTRTCERFLVLAFEELGLHRVELLRRYGQRPQSRRRRTPGHGRRGDRPGERPDRGGFVDLVMFGILERRMASAPGMSVPAPTGPVDAVLFDLDGTLVPEYSEGRLLRVGGRDG